MENDMSIRISEKYGVNPTIPVCFWCGKEKNEIALLGKLKGDIEAPARCIIDYEPCEECQKRWNSEKIEFGSGFTRYK